MEFRSDSSTVLAFIENLFRSYFHNHIHEFGHNASFSRFNVLWGSTTVEYKYPADLCGFISYDLDGTKRASRRFRVQYYHCPDDHPDRSTISSLFANEVTFYNVIWPLCVNGSTHSLVPHFILSDRHVTESMGALIFVHDDAFHNWSYECLQRCEHMELLARRIGEFHGRVLETRTRNEAQLSEAMALMSPQVQPDADLAIPTLLRCIDLLEADLQFMRKPDSPAGIRRLQQLVVELESRVRMPPQVNPACSVLCHRNYSTACGLFRYEELALAEAKIVYWGMVGWSSLADDLVALMFVDSQFHGLIGKRQSFVDEYIAGRRDAFPDDVVLFSQDIWQEIRLRIPLALQILASRVNCLSERTVPGSLSGRKFPWDDQFVVDVYKLLISNDLV